MRRLRFTSPGWLPPVPDTVYTPAQLARLYDFPEGDGTGQTIALIELMGGYREEDLDAWFQQQGVDVPEITDVSAGGKNEPSTPPSLCDLEVTADLCIAGAFAPKAKFRVYFAGGSTDRQFLRAVSAAVNEDASVRAQVIAISWSAQETVWDTTTVNAFNAVLEKAAKLGITVCVSAGDAVTTGQLNQRYVHFPASSPWALGCGASALDLSPDQASIAEQAPWYMKEAVHTTGGGYSQRFPRPDWQKGLSIPNTPASDDRRLVPDVTSIGSNESGYSLILDGKPVGGWASSVAPPLWAGLIARINQALGEGRTAGFLNPTLYALQGDDVACRDVLHGTTGLYQAGVGWDATSGLGSPIGNKLLAALQKAT